MFDHMKCILLVCVWLVGWHKGYLSRGKPMPFIPKSSIPSVEQVEEELANLGLPGKCSLFCR